MGRRKHSLIRNNKSQPIGWKYICDAEADMSNPPDDMYAAIVVTPGTDKSQFRVRKSDGTFGELDEDIPTTEVIY